MFQFENPEVLYALLLIPLFILLFLMSSRWRKKAVERFGDHELVSRLIPDFSMRRHATKFLLYILAFAFTVIGLANPQIGSKTEKITRRGIDVIIALDISKSMLAEDLQPNRLERAKQLVSNMISTMNDDRVGVIVFAGHAYLQMPLTYDYGAAKQFLSVISPDMVPTQGTALSDAIELARSSFEQEQKKHKAIILISDGEDHEKGALAQAEAAVSEGAVIYTLGVGSAEGAPIPIYQNGRKAGHKQSSSGELVVTKLNEKMMVDLARAGRGEYFSIRGAPTETATVIDALNKIEKRDYEDRSFTDYEDQFQYFIGIALLLVLIEMLISERSTGWFKNWSLFEPRRTE